MHYLAGLLFNVLCCPSSSPGHDCCMPRKLSKKHSGALKSQCGSTQLLASSQDPTKDSLFLAVHQPPTNISLVLEPKPCMQHDVKTELKQQAMMFLLSPNRFDATPAHSECTTNEQTRRSIE
eukprot:246961-Amphidinium_carterae.1